MRAGCCTKVRGRCPRIAIHCWLEQVAARPLVVMLAREGMCSGLLLPDNYMQIHF